MWHDWLPNEVKIQYRGPTWTIVYEQFYLPDATQVQLKLGRKQWMRSRKFAITELHDEFFSGITHTKLKKVRNDKKRCVTPQHAHNNMFTQVARARCPSRIFSGNCFRLLNAMHHTVHMRHWGRPGTLSDTQDTLVVSHSGRKYLYSPPRYHILDFAMS